MIKVAGRIVTEEGKSRRLRASLVSCDFAGCDKALELPVNLQSSENQCIRDTIRYIDREHPHGWVTDARGSYWYCSAHAIMLGVKRAPKGEL